MNRDWSAIEEERLTYRKEVIDNEYHQEMGRKNEKKEKASMNSRKIEMIDIENERF